MDTGYFDWLIWASCWRRSASQRRVKAANVGTAFPIGQRITLPGNIAEPVALESVQPLGDGCECRVRLGDDSPRKLTLERISIDPRICFGRPCIRGTRIWVSLIVDNLADGVSEAELLTAYQQLQTEDIRAALAFAAEMTRERIIPIPVEAGAP